MRHVINKITIKLESRSINEGFARQTVRVGHSLTQRWRNLAT